MSEARINVLEVSNAQITMELKYISETLNKMDKKLDLVPGLKYDVDNLSKKIREHEKKLDALAVFQFIVDNPKISMILVAGLYALAWSDVRAFLFGF